MRVTEAMLEAFREAWHKADDENRVGERVRDGLEAALAAADRGPLDDIAAERERQIEKGWTREHDDEGGVVHLVSESHRRSLRALGEETRAELVQAAALLVAAIEALDRRTS